MSTSRQLGVPRAHQPATVVGVQVKRGDQVDKQAPLLVYEYRAKLDMNDPTSPDHELVRDLRKEVAADGTFSKREYLRSPFEGEVSDILCEVGDNVVHGQPLVEVTMSCAHGTVFNGLCVLCGKDVSNIDVNGIPDTQANIDMFHEANGLKVSTDVATTIGANSRDVLWQQRKLSLIIDLDQTIIHANATLDPEFEPWLIDNYKSPEAMDTDDANQPAERRLPPDIAAFHLSDSVHRYFVKLRPGLRAFLEDLSQLYEMHIYTLGTRPYADAIAAIIDPDGRYFNRRILSRSETQSSQKNLARLFPVDTSMVAILDDRADVWGWPPNLIKVHRYAFFRDIGDINAGNLPPLSPPENATAAITEAPVPANDPEEDPARAAAEAAVAGPAGQSPFLGIDDRELEMLQRLLRRMHTDYYTEFDATGRENPPDLADILTAEKKRVLAGVSIVFSAAFPIVPGSPPPHHTELWNRARIFGAHCGLEITDDTTHVVAGKPGTEKVHAARARARGAARAAPSPVVVKVQWLLDSVRRWQKLDEDEYLWYDSDKTLLVRNRELAAGPRGSGVKGAVRRRLLDQEPGTRGAPSVDSADTTDIEEELQRQEAGLGEHAAEVDSFVQNLDWDDLEREAMEDSESDDNASRPASATDLRQTAMRQAARKQVPTGQTDEPPSDSSDAFGESSSSSGSDGDGATRHRMKRRRTSAESGGRHKANRKRMSQLSIDDGSVDLGTASEDSVEGSATATTTRSRLAKAAGMGDRRPSILGKRSKREARRSPSRDGGGSGDDEDECEPDKRDIVAPLFAGIEDEDEDAVLSAAESGGDDSPGEDHQWGEDDDSDDANFDDLINTLEEEISSS
ncbi:CTD phosphatase Fcp1 [Coemansia spiralis]|nr:CTD phosphatase Fcp1 [Coemansia spiralis]